MSEKPSKKSHRELFLSILADEANNSYALVELYRWEHGELPPKTGSKELNLANGVRAMARSFAEREQSKWPTPLSVASVLEYTAVLLEKHNIQPDWLQSGIQKPGQ